MTEHTETPQTGPVGDDVPADLPAVEPPTAGFFVQLFLIPALIVAVIVVVYVLFGKIAGGQRTPEEYLNELRGSNQERRWWAARELASLLPHERQWQENEPFAAELAAELESRLGTSETAELELQFQKFLAVALGEFKSPAGIRALRRAIEPGVDAEIREAAIIGLGRLSDRLGGLPDTAAVESLVAVTKDEDALLRKLAAFALGATGRSEAAAGLQPLLSDADLEVRYNAAASIARLGSTASLDTIGEMLDLKQLQSRGLSDEQLFAIPLSAVTSLRQLVRTNPQADIDTLRPAIEGLRANAPIQVKTVARSLLNELDARHAARGK